MTKRVHHGKTTEKKDEPTPKRRDSQRPIVPFPATRRIRWRGWRERDHRPPEVQVRMKEAAEAKRERRVANRRELDVED